MKILRFLIPLLLISCTNVKGTIVNKYYEPKHKYYYLDGKTQTDSEDYVFIVVDATGRYRVEVSKRKYKKHKVGDRI